jgi:trehalose 6-phosphate synthase/phosphatase
MDDFTLDVVDDDMDVGAEVEQASMLQHEYLSVAEQEILASIQELQRQLSELKTEEQHDQQGEEGEKGEGAPSEALRDMRVIVVANRLPISASRDAKTGEWNFKMSSGGLVTALQGVRDEMEFLWIGWLGGDVPLDEQEAVAGQLLKDYSCVPVFLDDELVDKYYNGFSNDVLWPLFHYVPLPMYKAGGEKKFDAGLWEAYKEANIRFANVVSSVYMDGDFVWVHDYHLMRLPFELRRQHPQCRIGWFLHTPFPSSEVSAERHACTGGP